MNKVKKVLVGRINGSELFYELGLVDIEKENKGDV